jgi:hypothetical protein
LDGGRGSKIKENFPMDFYVDPTPPARKRQKGVTLLDKWLLLNMIVEDPKLSPVDKLTAFALLSFFRNSDGLCCPHVSTIAKAICKSERTVNDALTALRKRGWVRIRRRRSSSLYVFTVPRDAQVLAGLDVQVLADLNTGTSTRGKPASEVKGLSTYSESEVGHMATVTFLADHRAKRGTA